MSDWLGKPNLDEIARRRISLASEGYSSWFHVTQELDPHIRTVLQDVAEVVISGDGWSAVDKTERYTWRYDEEPLLTDSIENTDRACRYWQLESVARDKRYRSSPLLKMFRIKSDATFNRPMDRASTWIGTISAASYLGGRTETPPRNHIHLGTGIEYLRTGSLYLGAEKDYVDTILAFLKQEIRAIADSGQVTLFARHKPRFSRPYWIVKDVDREWHFQE